MLNKTNELMIKRLIAKKMNVKTKQVSLYEYTTVNNINYDFEINITLFFNIEYNMYTNEGYECRVMRYNKDDKFLVHSIEVNKNYRNK